jgi:hypothetical protein
MHLPLIDINSGNLQRKTYGISEYIANTDRYKEEKKHHSPIKHLWLLDFYSM